MTPARRTRLVCTLAAPRAGGSRPQDGERYVEDLVAAGMDVARVNLSHSRGAADLAAGGVPRYDAEESLLRRIRAASDAAGRHVGVLLDLQGEKVRLRLPAAARERGLALDAGGEVRVRITREPRAEEVSCDGPPALLDAVRAALAARGALSVAIGDGEPFLTCGSLDGDVVLLRTPEPCVLVHGKGVTFRGLRLTGVPPLTTKDLADLAALVLPSLVSGDADFVALSFTQSAADVRRVRDYCDAADAFFRSGRRPADSDDAALLRRVAEARPDLAARYAAGPAVRPFVVAKIETELGAERIDDVLDETDAVMVARGDLGLHAAPEEVPALQKRIVRDARRRGRPAIVATQMLESMVASPEPRRSEATDVFNAVLDGADALMLSAETAAGSRPADATATLARIAVAAETWEVAHRETRDAWLRAVERDLDARRGGGVDATTDRVTAEAVRVAEAVGAAAIVAATRSGRTARNLARFDPVLPVVAVVPDARTARGLALVGAVRAVVAAAPTGEAAVAAGLAQAVARGWLRPGDRVVVASARPDDPPGATTTLSVRAV